MTDKAPPDELLTPEELAAYTKLAAGSIRNMVSRRAIPFVKVGRLTRFRRSEIDAWMEAHRDSGEPRKGVA
jgi:putative molybdopterin biosynthesis protein